VTHDQVEAMTLADRMIVMNGGRIEQAGRPNAIYDAPASVFVGGFIGSPPMSFLDGVMRDGRRVELPGGGALDVDAATFQTAPGDRVRVGLRAEAMQVAAERPPGRPTARVEFFEELGPGRLLHLDLAGAPLVALVGKTVDFPAGAEVGLTALAADVHLYDPASGRRLSSGRAAAAAAA
jgi:sn-glycerol 3-phosphate transport system ATP-binding protein